MSMSVDNRPGEVVEIQAEDFANLAKPTDEMPLPTDLRTMLLLGIFVLLSFYTLYVAREIFDSDPVRLHTQPVAAAGHGGPHPLSPSRGRSPHF